MGQDINHKD